MIKYNPLFHDKSLKLKLPIHYIGHVKIDQKLRDMGFILPEVPKHRKVMAYILHPQDMDEPCSFIVIEMVNDKMSLKSNYGHGVSLYDQFDFDELDFDFFERRYGRG